MEENKQIEETNQVEKEVTSSVTPPKTVTPVRRTATRKPVVKKEVVTKPVLTTSRPARVRKPIEKKPTEENTASTESITVTIADESGNDIVEEINPANQETKKFIFY